METAITLISPSELNLADEEKARLSALVQARLEETKTLTVVSTEEQFQAAKEHVKVIAQLRSRLESAIRPYIDFWHRGHKTHTQLLATLDGPSKRANGQSSKASPAISMRKKRPAGRRKSGCGVKVTASEDGGGRLQAQGDGSR